MVGKGSRHTKESIRKISEAKKGHKYPNRGPLSEEHKRNIGDAVRGEKHHFYGKKHTEATKRKMSEWQKGGELSEEHKRKLSENHADVSGKNNSMYGKTHSEETRRKIGNTNRREKNGNWNGGSSNLPYALDFDKELRELTKKRDGYRCHYPDCGTIDDLVVHHVDYDKQNSDPKNLITLCRSHNGRVNSNREHWTDYFKGGV